jgi:heterogeneous nuclear rnp K-like protein
MSDANAMQIDQQSPPKMEEVEQPAIQTTEQNYSGDGSLSSDAAVFQQSNNGIHGVGSAPTVLTLRSLVSTKEAGVIIGKGGANVAELREKSGVKAGVSKVIQGVHDRVLSITGTIDAIALAFSLIAATILENPLTPGMPAVPASDGAAGSATIRLLIAHSLMGTVIGRQGLKIKHIQDTSGVRMVASKDMLPSSTERIVEVQGSVQGIQMAVGEIGRCLLEDWERGQGTILYNPALDTSGAGVLAMTGEGGLLPQPQGGRRGLGGQGFNGPFTARRMQGMPHTNNNTSRAAAVNPGGTFVPPTTEGGQIPAQVIEGDIRVQNISIPSDMVGCIIGKGGSKITEIRRLSGSRISIAKVPHDDSGERMFTIQGTAESNEKALFLLYNSLEQEKERRASAQGPSLGGEEGVNGSENVKMEA